jgi:GT2 family glycosyltransferase
MSESAAPPAGVDYAIVDYDTPALAQDCVRSIERCYEGTGAPFTTTVRDAKRLGESYAQAVNRALAGSMSPYVCALNADTVMREFPQAVFDVFASDPAIAVVGPRQVDADNRIRHAGVFGPNEKPQHRMWGEPLTPENDAATSEFALDAAMVSGSVLFARRDVWEELGGFLETRHYFEDTAFCFLARHRGYRVVYTGATTWLHLWNQSLPSEGDSALAAANQEQKVEWFRESKRQFREFCREQGIVA